MQIAALFNVTTEGDLTARLDTVPFSFVLSFLNRTTF